MRSRGAESISFDIIVAAGPNGALPHHRAGKKIIENGDPVVIDMGCVYEGYCSDLSRTIVAGSPDESFRHVYNTVLGAQEQAEDSVRAGMTGGETDAISREMIASAGFGENFGHSLGHGVGLEVHEYPRLGPKTPDRLENGMVFTIEPRNLPVRLGRRADRGHGGPRERIPTDSEQGPQELERRPGRRVTDDHWLR